MRVGLRHATHLRLEFRAALEAGRSCDKRHSVAGSGLRGKLAILRGFQERLQRPNPKAHTQFNDRDTNPANPTVKSRSFIYPACYSIVDRTPVGSATCDFQARKCGYSIAEEGSFFTGQVFDNRPREMLRSGTLTVLGIRKNWC